MTQQNDIGEIDFGRFQVVVEREGEDIVSTYVFEDLEKARRFAQDNHMEWYDAQSEVEGMLEPEQLSFDRCPICNSTDLDAGQFEADAEWAACDVRCHNCLATWREVYGPVERTDIQVRQQDRRYWVLDSHDYDHVPNDYVGLVDEKAGGIVAFGAYANILALAQALNGREVFISIDE